MICCQGVLLSSEDNNLKMRLREQTVGALTSVLKKELNCFQYVVNGTVE
jgi:hypothetical protein